MTRKEFSLLMAGHFDKIAAINQTKGKDYQTGAKEDALSNFKHEAKALGLSPEQVWGVYASKHWNAIMSYCRNGQVESEPIESRLHDIILYSFLLLGLIEEKQANYVSSDLSGAKRALDYWLRPQTPTTHQTYIDAQAEDE